MNFFWFSPCVDAKSSDIRKDIMKVTFERVKSRCSELILKCLREENSRLAIEAINWVKKWANSSQSNYTKTNWIVRT